MKRHVFRERNGNQELSFYKQYTMPSVVRVNAPLPDVPFITYSFILHGEIVSPIQEIDCTQLSPTFPLHIIKDGLLGCLNYSSDDDTCKLEELERFTIFPEHALSNDERSPRHVVCCKNNENVFFLEIEKEILLSNLIKNHILPYHIIHFNGLGISIQCAMCSGMESEDVIEYLLWESKIFHQLTNTDANGFLQLYLNYQRSLILTENNTERILFVLSQFNHLFSASLMHFAIQVQFISGEWINFIVHKIGISLKINFQLHELNMLLDYIINVRQLISYLNFNMTPFYQDAYNQVHEQYKTLVGRFNAWYKLLPWGFMDLFKEQIHNDKLDSYLSQEATYPYPYIPELDPYNWAKRILENPFIISMISAGLFASLFSLFPNALSFHIIASFFVGGLYGIIISKMGPKLYLKSKQKKEGKRIRSKKSKASKK